MWQPLTRKKASGKCCLFCPLGDRMEAHYKCVFRWSWQKPPVVPSSDPLDNALLPWLPAFSVLFLPGPFSCFLNLLTSFLPFLPTSGAASTAVLFSGAAVWAQLSLMKQRVSENPLGGAAGWLTAGWSDSDWIPLLVANEWHRPRQAAALQLQRLSLWDELAVWGEVQVYEVAVAFEQNNTRSN